MTAPDHIADMSDTALQSRSRPHKNYGQMAKNAMNPLGQALKKHAGEMRSMAEFVELEDYELLTVRHTTVACAEAMVKVTAKTIQKDVSGIIEVFAFRSKPDGDIAMPQDEGRWCVQQNCIYSVMNEKFVDHRSAIHEKSSET